MNISFSSSVQSHAARPVLAARTVVTAATALLLLALCVPVFTAGRSPLNSDQSLYLSEALNIASGRGLTYPTGEPITHRAPLYPAMLAGALRADSTELEAAYIVPRIAVVANVLLLFVLGRALFGPWGGAVAGIAAASSLYMRGLGTSLFLDSVQATFLLAALLVYWHGRSSPRRMFVAGGLLGVSFLVKEASVLFLPLPVVLALAYGAEPAWKRVLPAWYAGFAVTTAWWFVWVYAHTGALFLVGPPDSRVGALLAAATLSGLVALAALLRLAPGQLEPNRVTLALAGLVVAAWSAVFFIGLEATGWAYDSDYLHSVTRYVREIFLPNVQPAALVLVSWFWAFWTAKSSRPAGIVVAGFLLYSSFFVVVADRGLSLRDQLPAVYLSYLALGGAAAWLVRTGEAIDLGARVRRLGGGGAVAVVVALAATVLLSGSSVSQPRTVMLQDDWHNTLAQRTASWLEQNVEPGSAIMASRLYYSHLYFLTDGAYPMHQLPTVEVDLDLSPDTEYAVTRASTLFRWEDHEMPADAPGEPWLYLTRYPVKGYFIGLAENDLLAELRERQIDYVVITSLDAGFSSPSFNRYFEDNPAFVLVQVISATQHDEARVYRLDHTKLAPQQKPAQVTLSAYEYMIHRLSSQAEVADYLERVNPAGFRLTER